MNEISVKGRLALSFGTLAALVLVTAGMSLFALSQSDARFENYVRGTNARALAANAVRTAVDRRAIAIRNLALVTQPEDVAAEKAAVTQSHDDVGKNLARLEDMAKGADVTNEARARIRAVADVESTYSPIAIAIFKLLLDGKRDEAIAKMNADCRPHLAALVDAVDVYLAYTQKQADGELAEAAAESRLQRLLLAAACLVTFLVAALAGVVITRRLVRELGAEPRDLSLAAQRVAAGDLGDVAGAAAAAKGSVLASLAAMQQELARLVTKVRGAADSIATGSSEIAVGNSDLSRRTEEQASNLQQTAASMEELSSTVKANADTARQARQLASTATDSATHGGDVVGQVISTMDEISTSSRRIGDIIGVIDGIAFQTNILALNAAVEAARAGEQGRGFAVVAAEVRSLAQRSAEAAREIKALIAASTEKVEAGATLVGTAGSAMDDIVAKVKRVADLIGEISSATTEQSTGIGQVGEAVSRLDQTTQQNAALVEESAAAAESLRLQAASLSETVRVFKLAVAVD